MFAMQPPHAWMKTLSVVYPCCSITPSQIIITGPSHLFVHKSKVNGRKIHTYTK